MTLLASCAAFEPVFVEPAIDMEDDQAVRAQQDCLPVPYRDLEIKELDTGFVLGYDDRHMMSFGDDRAGAERALEIIQRYEMTLSCYVSRPDPTMRYFLVQKEPLPRTESLRRAKAPSGSLEGESCVVIDRDTIEVRQQEGNWVVSDANELLLDFGPSERDARIAHWVINDYEFEYYCDLGTADSQFEYFRN